MGMAEQQKHHTKARIAQFQQATLDPDAIDYDMLSHENFLRLYLEQLSEQDLEILINHLNTLESSDPKWDTLQLWRKGVSHMSSVVGQSQLSCILL